MTPAERLAELEDEVRRLRVINDVLIQRVEREMDPAASSAFSLFYNTVTVDSSVSHRTTTLTNLARRLVQEIAERKEAESALLEAKAAAEQANESKTNFLAAVSHDLRQPLHAARLYLGEAAQTKVTARDTTLIGRAESALDAMDDMLESLLDMARLDSGSWRVDPESFALEPLLARLMAEIQGPAKAAGLRLRHVRTAAAVHTDRRLLEQVLRNLIGNALHYTERGGVLIGCRPRGDLVRIDVVDSGIGIAPEKWGVIFQEFHQLGAPARHTGKGLGLGLAVVDRASRLIGATIEVNSVLGRGSRFSVTLPRLALPATAPAPGALAQPAQFAPTGAVMLVEDDPAVRAAMSGLLKSWQCPVIAVESTPSALAYLDRNEPAPRVIIADYHLANGDCGASAVQAVRAKCGIATPALLISSDRGEHIRAAARDAGVVLLFKPVAPSKLRATLTHLFGVAASLDRAG